MGNLTTCLDTPFTLLFDVAVIADLCKTMVLWCATSGFVFVVPMTRQDSGSLRSVSVFLLAGLTSRSSTIPTGTKA